MQTCLFRTLFVVTLLSTAMIIYSWARYSNDIRNFLSRMVVNQERLLLPDCGWPPPLYPHSPRTPAADMAVLSEVQGWATHHQNDSFLYLYEGGLVGMYRDGGLIPGDGDIDVMYHVNSSFDEKELNRLMKLKSKSTRQFKLSFQADRFRYHTKYSLCKPIRSPLQTLDDARTRLEFRYGPHWFVKMPWKCQVPRYFLRWSRPDPKNREDMFFHHSWRRSVNMVKNMDKNKDGVVNKSELDSHVIKDGIDEAEYRLQITSRDRCRAAAMLTWLLAYDKKPFEIPDTNGMEGNHTLFTFPECDLKAYLVQNFE